ncbi:MAG: thioredoxin family protein [Acidimicrobiales bacterium]
MFRRPDTSTKPQDRRPAEIEVVDDSNFERLTSGRPTVVDLWAPWCGPCHSFRPIFEAVAATWGRTVRFGSCNVDDSPNTAMLLQVRSIPTVVAFGADGSEVDRLVGVPSRVAFEAFVTRLVALSGEDA